ncbi:hypothetical protein GCM10011492_06540 [Flexivirga endophytica]|uniref:Uncharacterized protein n=1 Tax=Flexivirga endophytica TaxID=1849103 RepID=A0A916WQ72_9MICO|nr:hypothetical protein [Flexivirga endophytica]GGB19389.1 hypothetical protein GCM10011492_06540 [Flexivirga endophytica]GHB36309.1 hypothetical protein GCM10008112_01070 [Flexivirga endophytica]
MSKSIERGEARARAMMTDLLRPGEQIVLETRAFTGFGNRAAARPLLLALTDQRLLACETVNPRWASGYGWGRIRDLQIRRKWWYVDVSFRVELGRGEGRSNFDHIYSIRKKGAEPFLDALRSRWTARHPGRET